MKSMRLHNGQWFIGWPQWKEAKPPGKDQLAVLPVNDRFQEALDYRKYRLADNSSHYDNKVAQSVAESAEPLQV